jgi:hypothetical protein
MDVSFRLACRSSTSYATLENTPIGYYLLPIAQLLVFFCILLILAADLSITARAGLAILALVTPGVLINFGGLSVRGAQRYVSPGLSRAGG